MIGILKVIGTSLVRYVPTVISTVSNLIDWCPNSSQTSTYPSPTDNLTVSEVPHHSASQWLPMILTHTRPPVAPIITLLVERRLCQQITWPQTQPHWECNVNNCHYISIDICKLFVTYKATPALSLGAKLFS